MKKISIFIFSLLFFYQFVFSQAIENVLFKQKRTTLTITYDITGAKPGETFDISIYYKINNSHWQLIPQSTVTGDVGKKLTAGTDKKIVWNPAKNSIEIDGELQFQVKAKVNRTETTTTTTTTTNTDNTSTNPRDLPTRHTERATGIPFDMIMLQGGTFKMGSNDGDSDEKPVHSVTVDDFYIGEHEVTNEEFAAFLNDYGSDKVKSGEFAGQTMIYEYQWGVKKNGNTWQAQSGYEKHPVVYVTWYGANEFCNWLSAKTGQTYRLPSEAQWEYAAGGGATRGHAPLSDYAWYDKNSYDLGSSHKDYGTHTVGTKTKNALGLYDMSGNVWEWCLDWYDGDYYKNSPQKDPVNTAKASGRVVRGGGWGGNADRCRVAYRSSGDPTVRSGSLGFRLVLLP